APAGAPPRPTLVRAHWGHPVVDSRVHAPNAVGRGREADHWGRPGSEPQDGPPEPWPGHRRTGTLCPRAGRDSSPALPHRGARGRPRRRAASVPPGTGAGGGVVDARPPLEVGGPIRTRRPRGA